MQNVTHMKEVMVEVVIATKEEHIMVAVQLSLVMATGEPPTKSKVTFNVIIVKITSTMQLSERIHKKKEVIAITTMCTWSKTRLITCIQVFFSNMQYDGSQGRNFLK